MTTFNDSCAGVPAPSDFEFEFKEARCAQAKIEHRQSRLAQAEQRIERLEAALTDVVRAIADTIDEESFDLPIERHLAHAAQVLGLNLADLGLKYTTPADKP